METKNLPVGVEVGMGEAWSKVPDSVWCNSFEGSGLYVVGMYAAEDLESGKFCSSRWSPGVRTAIEMDDPTDDV